MFSSCGGEHCHSSLLLMKTLTLAFLPRMFCFLLAFTFMCINKDNLTNLLISISWATIAFLVVWTVSTLFEKRPYWRAWPSEIWKNLKEATRTRTARRKAVQAKRRSSSLFSLANTWSTVITDMLHAISNSCIFVPYLLYTTCIFFFNLLANGIMCNFRRRNQLNMAHVWHPSWTYWPPTTRRVPGPRAHFDDVGVGATSMLSKSVKTD